MLKRILPFLVSLLVVVVAVAVSALLFPLGLNNLVENWGLGLPFATDVAATFFLVGAAAAIALFPEFAEIPVGVLIENGTIGDLANW